MKTTPKWNLVTLLALVLVAGCAGGARSWYLFACTDQGEHEAALQVQGDSLRLSPQAPAGTAFRGRKSPTDLDNIAANVGEHHWIAGWAPFAKSEEATAHTAPGYPWLLGILGSLESTAEKADWVLRWLQCVLGSLTVVCLFLFTRRTFHNTLVATVAGLLAAFYPFWIINTAELNDGVLATFLLAAGLMLGGRASQTGGAFSGLFFGLALAGLCMVRAAMLPFAVASLLWFLLRCRRFPMGWFAGILSLVGFLNGLAPWTVRNYQSFGRAVPVTTTAYYHLWMGNNTHSTGSTMDESALRGMLTEERVKELLDESNQAKRYDLLAQEFWDEVRDHPKATLARRIQAALVFLFGDTWMKQQRFLSERSEGEDVAPSPEWVTSRVDHILNATILVLFFLALLGWRWSYPWHLYGRLATIAAVWIPVPYILSHAEALSGPRLPFDGVLLCFAAYALVSLVPGLVRNPEIDPSDDVIAG